MDFTTDFEELSKLPLPESETLVLDGGTEFKFLKRLLINIEKT